MSSSPRNHSHCGGQSPRLTDLTQLQHLVVQFTIPIQCCVCLAWNPCLWWRVPFFPTFGTYVPIAVKLRRVSLLGGASKVCCTNYPCQWIGNINKFTGVTRRCEEALKSTKSKTRRLTTASLHNQHDGIFPKTNKCWTMSNSDFICIAVKYQSLDGCMR